MNLFCWIDLFEKDILDPFTEVVYNMFDMNCCVNWMFFAYVWGQIFWLALPVGNEGPSTFTGWYIGDETSLIPYG